MYKLIKKIKNALKFYSWEDFITWLDHIKEENIYIDFYETIEQMTIHDSLMESITYISVPN